MTAQSKSIRTKVKGAGVAGRRDEGSFLRKSSLVRCLGAVDCRGYCYLGNTCRHAASDVVQAIYRIY